MNRLPVRRRASLPRVSLEEALDAAADYAKSSCSAATWRAYEADWKVFREWCESVKLDPLPAASHTVALFLAAEAKLRRAPATLGRRLSAIRLMHLGAKLPSPHDALEVAEVLRDIRRRWKRPPAQKAPAVDEDIKRMVDAVEPQTLKGLRDRALLLLGFAGALRRSELVALDTDQLIERDEGIAVRIASSKTDQEGSGPDGSECEARLPRKRAGQEDRIRETSRGQFPAEFVLGSRSLRGYECGSGPSSNHKR